MAQKHREPNIPPIQQGSVFRDFMVGVTAGVVVTIAAAAFLPQSHAHTHAECSVEETAD